MKVRVLGCHGSDHLLKEPSGPRHCRACGLLVNETLLVDAGTIGAVLTLEEQRRIRHVLVSHLHFDHIQGLPLLADNLVDDPARPLVLHSIPEVLKGLQSHIFNGEVYPDFMQLPDPHRPVFSARPLEPRRTIQVGDLRVTAVPVNHLVPTVGFVIEDGTSTVVYSGDTYETEELWRVAGNVPNLKAAFIECSFPESMPEVAKVSRHLTPSLFAREVQKIGRPDVPIYAYHLKPRYRDTIQRELSQLGISKLMVLEEGQSLVV